MHSINFGLSDNQLLNVEPHNYLLEFIWCVCVCVYVRLSVSVYIDDCVFCVPEFVSGSVGKNDGNACCHQNQRVHRKKELNQVQSRAFRAGWAGGEKWCTD